MPKRKRIDCAACDSAVTRPFKVPRRINMKNGVKRAYPSSRVPLASRGYRLNSVERKTFDINTVTIQVNTTGNFALLCAPQKGTDFNTRIGRKLTMRSFYVRGRVQIEAVGTLPVGAIGPQMIRMIIFMDYQPNGAPPAVLDLLNEASPISQLNLNNRDRFKVLSEKVFVFDPYIRVDTATQAMVGFNRTVYGFKKYKSIKEEVIFNAGNAGTIADITSGALIMFWIGSQAAGGLDSNAITTTRVRFTDA